MKPEGSLKHSQGRDSCPILGSLIQSNSANTPLPDDTSYYLPPIYDCVFQVVSVPQVSPPTPCICTTSHHTFYMSRPTHSSRF